jgi:hypothetical protein
VNSRAKIIAGLLDVMSEGTKRLYAYATWDANLHLASDKPDGGEVNYFSTPEKALKVRLANAALRGGADPAEVVGFFFPQMFQQESHTTLTSETQAGPEVER